MYSSITLIYNPNSTGKAPAKAREFAKRLQRSLPDVPVELLGTERAGHAVELAYEAAQVGREPLIISVSGDGGYHEVINGAMKAKREGHNPICAVLPAGNANDHRRMVRKRPLLQGIIAHDISELDVLEARWNKEHRFAHSYIGLGLSPVVAVELNRHTLSALKELVLVVKAYWEYQPLEIKIKRKKLRLDSLVVSNIPGMAKVLKLSKNGKPADGKFEVAMMPHRSKFSILTWTIKSATTGLGRQPQAKKINFTVLEDTPMQLDGEVAELTAGSKVKISIAHRMLKTVL